MFAALWQSVRIVHSMSGIFTVGVRPTPVKRAGDLWRMNTQNNYVKGEEDLTNWFPRGVSLIRDYIAAKRRKLRLAELDAAQPLLSKIEFPKVSTTALTNGKTHGETNGEINGEADGDSQTIPPSERDVALLEKYPKEPHNPQRRVSPHPVLRFRPLDTAIRRAAPSVPTHPLRS
jgi:kinesin family protein 1